ncbi:Glycine-rich RNA-binding protein 8 [Platanthera guangdongensis]|uniref:Glycine-rich RNA-binding protein 8 n=1 Tax=Platanthera guangdongensis TaxID=2320717 RepID=A0ABR2MXL6_9ASPA
MATSHGGNSPQYYRSRFGDTTLTKVFVGGLAWETPTEELRRYFQQFGEILEAVIITDKNSGRSKGYGFVTFRDPESARRSVADPNPLIDGRQANCNIAAMGRPRPSPPRGRAQAAGNIFQVPPAPVGTPYARVPAQMPPAQVIYPTPYGYMTYATDYGYQQGVYNPHLASQYYQQMMYGPTAPSAVSALPYNYPQMNYMMQSSRASFPPPSMLQAHRHPYAHHPTAQVETEGSFFPPSSLPHGLQLQLPAHVRQSLNTPGKLISYKYYISIDIEFAITVSFNFFKVFFCVLSSFTHGRVLTRVESEIPPNDL